jgi:hypothetical protein
MGIEQVMDMEIELAEDYLIDPSSSSSSSSWVCILVSLLC